MVTSKYILENENGERFDLTPPASLFLVNVEGLGTANGNSYADLDGGFYALTKDKQSRNGITGDIVYTESAFENFQALVNWLFAARELTFVYAPLDTEYRRKVKLKSIGKKIRDRGGIMRAAISFDPLTPWELPTPTEIGMTVRTGNVKGYFYDEDDQDYYYVYDSDLQYGGETGSDFSAEISASGHIPAAFVLRYTGALTNPEIRLVGASSGKVYGICKLTATTGATDTLELSTLYEDCHIRKIASGGTVTDMISTANLTYELYPHAPTDEAAVLSISSDSTMSGSAELYVYAYYRSV